MRSDVCLREEFVEAEAVGQRALLPGPLAFARSLYVVFLDDELLGSSSAALTLSPLVLPPCHPATLPPCHPVTLALTLTLVVRDEGGLVNVLKREEPYPTEIEPSSTDDDSAPGAG